MSDSPAPCPNYTRIPNVLFDAWMLTLSGAEFKLVLFVARKTYGWHKEAVGDRLSIAQIMEGTGLSRRAVIDASKALQASGALFVSPPEGVPNGSHNALNTYRLNLQWNGAKAEKTDAVAVSDAVSDTLPDALTGANNAPVQKVHRCKNSAVTGAENARVPVQKLHPQKKATKETLQKKAAESTLEAQAPTVSAPTPPPAEAIQQAPEPDPTTKPNPAHVPASPSLPLPNSLPLLELDAAALSRLSPEEGLRRFRAEHPDAPATRTYHAKLAEIQKRPGLRSPNVVAWREVREVALPDLREKQAQAAKREAEQATASRWVPWTDEQQETYNAQCRSEMQARREAQTKPIPRGKWREQLFGSTQGVPA